MTTADDAMPARLTEKPTWLISQASTQAHRLLTEKLAPAGARGYHYRLLAEEVDPASGQMIGNFPQAFSHIGLINAAWAIAQARQLTGST